MALRFQRGVTCPFLGLVLFISGCGGTSHDPAATGDPDATKPCIVSNDRLVFADAVVDEAVHTQLGLTLDALVTADDVRSLRSLTVRRGGVTTLDGLECLVNLQTLVIHGGTFEDLRPIAGLDYLHAIYLSDGRISDLSPLARLRNLDFVYLDTNVVKDVAPLLKLTRLFNLSLAANQVRDVRPLLQMPWLGELIVDVNPIDCSDPEQQSALAILQNRISKEPPPPVPLSWQEEMPSPIYGFYSPCSH